MKLPQKAAILVLAIFFFQISLLRGQEPKIIRLSWQKAVQSAVNDNLSLQIFRTGLRQQQVNRRKATYNFLPQLTFSSSGTKNIERPEFVFNVNGREQRFIIGSRYNIIHSLDLNVPLFLGGSRFSNLKLQKNLQKSLNEELQGKEADTVLLTLRNYFEALLDLNLIRVNTEADRVARENFRQVQSAYRQGTTSKLDLLRAKARASATIPALLSARNRFKLALQQLKQNLNIAPGDSLVLEDSLQTANFWNPSRNADEAALVREALQNRPEIHGAQWAIEAARNRRRLRMSAFFPDIVFNASLQQQAQVENIFPKGDEYTRIKRVSIAFQWPLFQSGQRFLDYQKASIEAEKFTIQKKLIEQNIAVEIHQAWYNYQDARARLQALRDSKDASEESLRTANLYFTQGLATQLDVIAAQLEVTRSKTELLKGIFQYNISQLQLMHATGRLNQIWK